MNLPLAQTDDQKRLWDKLCPVNRCAASDTYKRTMSSSSTIFSDNFAAYNLAARRPIKEEGANGRLIVAGLEKMLYPWFTNPIPEREVRTAQEFFTKKAQVKKFPTAAWEAVLANGGYFPIDIWALPGGQTILAKDGKHVPLMSIEGPGALVSHLEPHLENMFAPIIQATKARLFKEAVGLQFAEFGLRADENENNHVTLMLALYVGAGFQLTSDDQAVFLFPEYFKDIGTVGHEFIMAYQRRGISLEDAQEAAFEAFVKANERSALLPDVINTINSGLPAILRMAQKYDDRIVIPRFDSGDVPAQCNVWAEMLKQAARIDKGLVVEDGYTPTKARDTRKIYASQGNDPTKITPGAGGYFRENATRDAISLAYKRSATMHDGVLEASVKFSDSPGKGSLPGMIRVYDKGNVLYVAQAGEVVDGIPLMQKVVSNGRIQYAELLEVQRDRAEKTWNKYDTIEYSPQTLEIIALRTKERDEILARL